MPNEPNPFIGVVPTVSELNEINASALEQQGFHIQPVTVEVDGVVHHMHYGASEPEYVGRMPIRTDLEVLPLPPDRDSQDDLTFISNLEPPQDDFGGHALQVDGVPEPGQVLVANSWGSDWGPAPNFNDNLSALQANPEGGMLVMQGEHFNHDITFRAGNGSESLRISDSGDFFVQGRLVKNDLEVYEAFKVFLGLSMGIPSAPVPRDGIPTRYERILKRKTEGQ